MNRLSFHDEYQSIHPASWLKLLKSYFDDLIFKSFSECDAGYVTFGSCLEGSPFLHSFNDGDTCTQHLRRLVIFLYFKYCFTLIRWKETEHGCQCATKTFSIAARSQLCSETCCFMGFFELSGWLEVMTKSMECVTCSKSCDCFGLSFLHLYFGEVFISYAPPLIYSSIPRYCRM